MKDTLSRNDLQQQTFETATDKGNDTATDNATDTEEIKSIPKKVLDFSSESMIKGIIFSEIIGKPLSRRRYWR